jgi:hypothetical protein
MLTYADVCWRIQASASSCATSVAELLSMLTYADACWRMLTHADVCWRMLTYADLYRQAQAAVRRQSHSCLVCWRMLTYAGVCWRMQASASSSVTSSITSFKLSKALMLTPPPFLPSFLFASPLFALRVPVLFCVYSWSFFYNCVAFVVCAFYFFKK